ncbi:MAG: universal stress protein, partial [Thermoplasmata archaeon]
MGRPSLKGRAVSSRADAAVLSNLGGRPPPLASSRSYSPRSRRGSLMYRRLLVPVSTPPEVEPMIRFAASLLDADGEIRMLHVIPTTTMPAVTREWRASVNLVVPAHEVAAVLDVKVEPEVRASVDVPGEILESAEAHQVDGIVMSLGGDKRSRKFFVGHTASGILHHAHADVLILNRLTLANPKVPRILVPSLHGATPPRLLQLAEELALHHGGVPV